MVGLLFPVFLLYFFLSSLCFVYMLRRLEKSEVRVHATFFFEDLNELMALMANG